MPEEPFQILCVQVGHPDLVRNNDVGDWGDQQLGIRSVAVANFGSNDDHFLVALCLLMQQHLCLKHGITDAQVTAWDAASGDSVLAGEAENAPYHAEYAASLKLEQYAAELLGVDFAEHDRRIRERFSKK